MLKYLYFLLFTFITFSSLSAQCPAGEAEVLILVETDNWGYETYWELVPTGNNCGTGTIFSGGNASQVGCNGGGQQDATIGNGYGNNITVTEGPWCLSVGSSYDIKSIDDYGDGGAKYIIEVNGFEMAEITSSGSNSTESFVVEEPPLLDLSTHHNLVYDFTVKGPVNITAEFMNEGQNAITSFDFNYAIDNGTTQTQTLSGLNILYDEEVEFTHNVVWDAQQPGDYEVDVWVSNINGNGPDENPNNDHASKSVVVSASIPNILHSYVTEPFTIEEIANASNQINHPRDLDFHPDYDRKELWVINMGTENSGGSTVTISNAGESNQSSQYLQDGNAWHFMSLPTALAFGENGNWGTSHGVQDANHNGGTFTGPTLWSSDLSIYAVIGNPSTPAFNGSHLDMLHGSPYSMGIAHLEDNTFFVFDSWNNHIVQYNFNGDHGPGQDDHSNGEIIRFSEVFVERDGVEVPNHMVINKETGILYFADHKNSRIVQMDVNSGNQGNSLAQTNEPLALHVDMENVDFGPVITTGLTTPCGIDLVDNRLIVGDYSNGDILIYNIALDPPQLMTTINTGATGLMGVKIGPEGRIWYVDAESNSVHKINVEAVPDTASVGISNQEFESYISIYPNPSSSVLNVKLLKETLTNVEVTLIDATGKKLAGFQNIQLKEISLDISPFADGIYFVEIKGDGFRTLKKVIKK